MATTTAPARTERDILMRLSNVDREIQYHHDEIDELEQERAELEAELDYARGGGARPDSLDSGMAIWLHFHPEDRRVDPSRMDPDSYFHPETYGQWVS